VNKACPIWIRNVTYIWIRHVQCPIYMNKACPRWTLVIVSAKTSLQNTKKWPTKETCLTKKETYLRALYVRKRNLEIRRTKRHLQKSPLSLCRPRPSCNRQKGTDKKDLYARKETYQKALYIWRRDLQNRRTKDADKTVYCDRVVQDLHARGDKKGFFL